MNDYQSEQAKARADDESEPPETRGEARLGPGGETDLAADLPPNLPGARYDAQWELAVTSPDGQSVAAASPPQSVVMRQPVLLGIAADTADPDALSSQGEAASTGVIHVRLAAFNAVDKPARTEGVKVEIFRVGNKTVRENVGPVSSTRYHNTPRYVSVKTITVAAAGPDARPVLDLPVTEPGRYVAVASAPGLRPVSTELFADGPGEDEVPVKSETSLELRAEKTDYAPGEKAVFITRAPVTGMAWVSVETDGIVDHLLLPLPGNTTRLEIPVKPEYAPNARVAVYLLRPGGADRFTRRTFRQRGVACPSA